MCFADRSCSSPITPFPIFQRSQNPSLFEFFQLPAAAPPPCPTTTACSYVSPFILCISFPPITITIIVSLYIISIPSSIDSHRTCPDFYLPPCVQSPGMVSQASISRYPGISAMVVRCPKVAVAPNVDRRRVYKVCSTSRLFMRTRWTRPGGEGDAIRSWCS